MTDSGAEPADVDRLLIERFLQGDKRAFEVLVVKYQRRIAALIERIVRNGAVAEELTQETFIKAYRALPQFRGESRFSTWLHTIARNTAVGHVGSGQAQADRAAGSGEQPDDDIGSAGTSPSPEEELVSRQLYDTIQRAIAELPARQREALLLREVEGLSYAEIAERLKTPLNTVRPWIFRAREAVADKIQPSMQATRSRRW